MLFSFFAHVGTATCLDALCNLRLFLTLNYSHYIPHYYLLTASLILLVAFGPVSIHNPNSSSLFIIDHHSTDAAIVTLISFACFPTSVGSFFPLLIPTILADNRMLLSLSLNSNQNLETHQTECRLDMRIGSCYSMLPRLALF